MKKKKNCILIQKNLHFFSLCTLRPGGGGGLKALMDMSAKNVSLFGRLLLWMTRTLSYH